MNQTMFVIVQATTTLDLYRVGADIEQGINWDYDTDSDVDDDDDRDETFNATGGRCKRKSRPGSSKRVRRGEGRDGGSRTNWRSRPVDQLCARTLQVGWLHVSLKCEQMHEHSEYRTCMPFRPACTLACVNAYACAHMCTMRPQTGVLGTTIVLTTRRNALRERRQRPPPPQQTVVLPNAGTWTWQRRRRRRK